MIVGQTQDAEIHQGDDRILIDTIWANKARTVRRDLSGYTSAEYRVGLMDEPELALRVTASVNANGSFVGFSDVINGEIQITLAGADTALLEARRYTHHVLVYDLSNREAVVTDGFLTVLGTLPAA